jgi:hypothetical protein
METEPTISVTTLSSGWTHRWVTEPGDVVGGGPTRPLHTSGITDRAESSRHCPPLDGDVELTDEPAAVRHRRRVSAFASMWSSRPPRTFPSSTGPTPPRPWASLHRFGNPEPTQRSEPGTAVTAARPRHWSRAVLITAAAAGLVIGGATATSHQSTLTAAYAHPATMAGASRPATATDLSATPSASHVRWVLLDGENGPVRTATSYPARTRHVDPRPPPTARAAARTRLPPPRSLPAPVRTSSSPPPAPWAPTPKIGSSP